MTTTPRPTPETDVVVANDTGDNGFLDEIVKTCRRLERERDEARDQLEAMREAIREAHEALQACMEDSGELLAERGWWRDEPRCGYQARYLETKQRIEGAEAALTKLKPFILP